MARGPPDARSGGVLGVQVLGGDGAAELEGAARAGRWSGRRTGRWRWLRRWRRGWRRGRRRRARVTGLGSARRWRLRRAAPRPQRTRRGVGSEVSAEVSSRRRLGRAPTLLPVGEPALLDARVDARRRLHALSPLRHLHLHLEHHPIVRPCIHHPKRPRHCARRASAQPLRRARVITLRALHRFDEARDIAEDLLRSRALAEPRGYPAERLLRCAY